MYGTHGPQHLPCTDLQTPWLPWHECRQTANPPTPPVCGTSGREREGERKREGKGEGEGREREGEREREREKC